MQIEVPAWQQDSSKGTTLKDQTILKRAKYHHLKEEEVEEEGSMNHLGSFRNHRIQLLKSFSVHPRQASTEQ